MLPASCCPPSILSDSNNQTRWQKPNPRQAANWLVQPLSPPVIYWLPSLIYPVSLFSQVSPPTSSIWRPPAAMRNLLLTTNGLNLPVVCYNSMERLGSPVRCWSRHLAPDRGLRTDLQGICPCLVSLQDPVSLSSKYFLLLPAHN